MRIAVVIPTYNRPDLLRRALASVAAQTVPVEPVIVNDGDPVAVKGGTLLKTEGIGPTKARALALDFLDPGIDAVCYLDDDDELLPHHAEVLSKELASGCEFAFSMALYRHPDGTETADPEPGNTDPAKAYYDPDALLKQNIAPISSFMHTIKAYRDVGGWDRSLLRMEDWDLWGRMFVEFGPPGYVDEMTNVIYKGLGANRTDSNQYVYSMSCHWRDIVSDRLRYLAEKGRGRFLKGEAERFRVPRVGVVMPAYNAERYLREALDSLLAQTYRDFEILAINDGSTDGTARILEEYRATSEKKRARGEDAPEIRTFHLPRNAGVSKALNYGLLMSRSEYVARMDADDVSEPERFERQVRYLDSRPEVGILGTRFYSMDEALRRVTWKNDVPLAPEDVARELKKTCCMGHPTVMIRRKVVETVGGYDEGESCKAVEDYEFWLRASEKFGIANLPEYLLKYREYEGQVSQRMADVQEANFRRVRDAFLGSIPVLL